MIILILGMSIGVLQWLPWFGREFITNIYPFQDGLDQIKNLRGSLQLIRVHGFAQHATANGGIASFALVMGYRIRKYYRKLNTLSLALIVLSVVNIFISQARAGMFSALFCGFLLYVVNIKYERKGLKPTLYMLGAMSLLVIAVYFLYDVENPYIISTYNMWLNLFDTGGGAKATTQLQHFFSTMKESNYLFGLLKPIINRSAISYRIETEPLYIFVIYGAIGFILQYTSVAFLLRYFYKRISKKIDDKAMLTLIVASFVSLSSYQMFSVAYFFFREIRIGLFPWVLMGVTIGLHKRYKVKCLSTATTERLYGKRGNQL